VTAAAKTIYQDLLDRNSRALIARDVETWADGLSLPHRLTTCDGSLVLETPEHVRTTFEDYARALEKLGVTRMERSCEIARVSEPGWIAGYHTTALFREDGETLRPYTTKWVLRECDDGKWRASKADSALSAETWGDMPYDRLTLFRYSDTRGEVKFRQEVQKFLERVDTTMLHGDFEAWRQMYALPVVIEAREEQVVIDTEDKLRAEYDLYSEVFRIQKVTDVARVVKTAERLGDDMVIVTFRAHVMSGARYVTEPWEGAMTLRGPHGQWRVTKIMGATRATHWRTTQSEEDSAFDVTAPNTTTNNPTTGSN
jgi:hypothetical protein